MNPKDWSDVINGIIANVPRRDGHNHLNQTKTEAQEVKQVPANPTSRNPRQSYLIGNTS